MAAAFAATGWGRGGPSALALARGLEQAAGAAPGAAGRPAQGERAQTALIIAAATGGGSGSGGKQVGLVPGHLRSSVR